MPDTRTALVVGAGIGGLASAVALRHAGWRVRVHEQASSARTLGFALGLAPNAISALGELGLEEIITDLGARPTAVEVRRPDGRVLRALNVQAVGPSIVALRAELHGALLRAVGGDLVLGSRAESFSADGDGATVSLQNGLHDHGDILVGADGVNSAIRRCLHPEEAAPQPSGFCCVRGVASGAGDLLPSLSAVAYLGHGVEAAAARASHDTVYWYLSLLIDRRPVTPRDPRTIAEQEMRSFEPLFRNVVAATEDDAIRFDELLQRPPLQRWGNGCVTLLGDAAHPLLPHTGQGAAQALEDAVALGLVLSGPADVEPALRRYEHVRSRRTKRFVSAGPRIARITTTTNPFVKAFRTLVVRTIPEAVLAKAGALSSRDPHKDLRETGA
jgi:2-polyprenyl-6-methoxyphenol hydroxylase-like FAD-dependent oxidoreductase